MVATLPTPPLEIIHLSGISWQTYETLLKELSDRRLRLTYHRGNLEIMAPSPEPELSKEVLGQFVETLATEDYLTLVRAFRQWVRGQLTAAAPSRLDAAQDAL